MPIKLIQLIGMTLIFLCILVMLIYGFKTIKNKTKTEILAFVIAMVVFTVTIIITYFLFFCPLNC